jgi:hypothetical protein
MQVTARVKVEPCIYFLLRFLAWIYLMTSPGSRQATERAHTENARA